MEGVFNFAYLDAEIARASAAGKQVSIRVPSGADPMSAWVTAAVRNAGGSTVTFTDSSGQHTIPLFWDPTFLAKKNAVMAALEHGIATIRRSKLWLHTSRTRLQGDWYVPHDTEIDPYYGTSEQPTISNG